MLYDKDSMLVLEQLKASFGIAINFNRNANSRTKIWQLEFQHYIYDKTKCDLVNKNDKALHSFLDSFIHEDTKGCRNIYNIRHTLRNRSLSECVTKCNNTLITVISTKEMTDAFELNCNMSQYIYSKYIQQRVLHHRLYTEDIFVKINIIKDA